MRSYGQYCGLAKALDVVGDRWTLLIVRELLVCGPSRYSDLQRGLPGIATNLLADRLRSLEELGVVLRDDAAPPVATALFSLSEWGEQLRPSVMALGKWASPLLAKPARTDRFLSHWLAVPLEAFLKDREPKQKPIRLELRTGDQPMVLETTGSGVRVFPGSIKGPDAVLAGSPDLIIGLLVGKFDLATARARGLRFGGDVTVLERLRPTKSSNRERRPTRKAKASSNL